MEMKSSICYRFLALVLSLCILTGITPIISLADNSSFISITSHANGDVIESGTNIILQASWNMGDVSRVDFYANGNKIPGCITSDDEGLEWQSPASGSYSVKAVATYIGDSTEESEPVEIFVKPKGMVKGFYSASDLTGWKNNTAQYTSDNLTTDNAALGLYSVKPANLVNWIKYETPGSSFVLEDHDYINLLLYFENIPSTGVGTVSLSFSGPSPKMSASFTPENGWNKVSVSVADDNVGDEVTSIALGFGSSNIKEVASMYINGVYYSDNADSAFTATPVIPDGQEGVCNELTKYRIKFNNPLARCLVVDSSGITIDGIEGTTLSLGTDYIDINIPDSSLNYNTEYTVTIPTNTIVDCYGNIFAGTSFKFTTIVNNCDNVQPIPVLTFPKSGSKVSSSSDLVASVIFRGNVDSVGFYNGDVLIGSAGITMNGEYIFSSPSLPAGANTIKVKVLTKDGKVFESNSVTFTAVAANYRLVGLENNDTVIINESFGNKVFVIDDSEDSVNNPDATASNVSKVIYYINGDKVLEDSEAPYSYTLPADKIGKNDLKVRVYDIMGGICEFTRTYNAVDAYTVTSSCEDFEGVNPVIPENTVSHYTNDDGTYNIETSHLGADANVWQNTVASDAIGGSKAWYLNTGSYNNAYEKGTSTKLNKYGFNIALWPDSLDVTSNMNRVFLEFDYAVNYWSANQTSYIYLRDGFSNEKQTDDYGKIPLPPTDILGPNKNSLKLTHLGFDICWNIEMKQVDYKLYVNGMEYSRGTVSGTNPVDPAKLTPVLSAGFNGDLPFYLDNIRVATYIDKSTVITGEPVVEFYDDDNVSLSVLSDIDVNSAAYFTIDLPGGINNSTLSGNIVFKDSVTGDTVPVSIDTDGKLILPRQLKRGTRYDLIISSAVKNLDGKCYYPDKTVPITTKTRELLADRANTGFATSSFPALGSSGTVTFNSKITGSAFSGKSVDIVVAVYEGNAMVNLIVSTQTIPTTGILAPVNVTIDEMKQGMTVEAFIVDKISGSLATMNSVTEQVYILK